MIITRRNMRFTLLPHRKVRVVRRYAILFLVWIAQPIMADYQAGLDAYNNGDYTTAFSEWRAVAASPPGTAPPMAVVETHYAIGMLYWQGQGVTPSYFEAAGWMRKAAEMGHAGAQSKLGYLYTQGITVPQNYEIGFEWFSKAAKQGDVSGQHNLGIYYLNGWGVPRNKTVAAQYFAAAAAQGDSEAEANLTRLQPDMNQGPGKPEELVQPTEVPHLAEAGILTASWILNQNPDHYTIQVIGLGTESALVGLIEGHEGLRPFATYTQQKNNKPLHILIQGVYPDFESAARARDKFPATIQKPADVWIRQFQKVQALLGPITNQH